MNPLLIDSLPAFKEGKHYRQLHPTQEGYKRWRYVSRMKTRLPKRGLMPYGESIKYYDAKGRLWLTHDEFGILIEEGYACNGCSPKWWQWPFGWCGTIDFQSTILASFTHDIHYQFCLTEHFPFHRWQVDDQFRQIIEMNGDPTVAYVYHGAVRKYASWAGRKPNGEYSIHNTNENTLI